MSLQPTARSMRQIGFVFLVLSLLAALDPAIQLVSRMPGTRASVSALFAIAPYAGVGVGFRIAAANLLRHRTWATTLGILLATLGFVGSLGLMWSGVSRLGRGGVDVGFWVGGLGLLLVGGFLHLIWRLAQTYAAIHLHHVREGTDARGFEPIIDAESVESPSDADDVKMRTM